MNLSAVIALVEAHWLKVIIAVAVIFYVRFLLRLRPVKYDALPGPKPRYAMGALKDPDFNSKLMHETFEKWHDKYGHAYRWHAGPKLMIVVSKAEHVEKVLGESRGAFIQNTWLRDVFQYFMPHNVVAVEGTEWKHTRHILQTGISGANLRALAPIFNEVLEKDFVPNFSDASGKPQPIEFTQLSALLLLDAFGVFTFGSNPGFLKLGDVKKSPDFQTISACMDVLQVRRTQPLPWMWSLPTAINRKLNASYRELRRLFGDHRESYDKEIKKGTAKYDGTLLDEVAKASRGEARFHLTKEQIDDNMMGMQLAGYHTTNNTLTFVVDHLAQNPGVQADMVKRLAADDGITAESSLTAEDATRSKWLENMVKESTRLQPIVTMISRTAVKDVVLGSGEDAIPVPAGANVMLNGYRLSHDPAVWKGHTDLDKYRPTRFESAAAPRYGMLPFGAGSRMCIGMKLANLEMKLFLGYVLPRYVIKPSPDHPRMKVEYTAGLGADKDGAWFVFEPRK